MNAEKYVRDKRRSSLQIGQEAFRKLYDQFQFVGGSSGGLINPIEDSVLTKKSYSYVSKNNNKNKINNELKDSHNTTTTTTTTTKSLPKVKQEQNNKSCIRSEKIMKKQQQKQNSVSWRTSIKIERISKLRESLINTLFYNSSDYNDFRFDKYCEDNDLDPSEFEEIEEIDEEEEIFDEEEIISETESLDLYSEDFEIIED